MKLSVKRIMALAALASLFGVLEACSSGSNLPPPSPLPRNPHLAHLHQVWSHGIGSGGGNQLLGLSPAAFDHEVVVANAGGYVAAYRTNNGKRVWGTHIHGALSGGPGADNQVVAIGTRKGDVFALNAKTGKHLWKHYVGAAIISAPAVKHNYVAVKTTDGKLIGLSVKTGKQLWVTQQNVPSLILREEAAPLAADGLVFSGFANGRVVAVDPSSGKPVWHKQIAKSQGGNPVSQMVDVGGPMAFAGGDLYVATYQGKLAALSARSGQIFWSHDLSSYTGVAVGGARVYVSTTDGEVEAFDLVTGVPEWKYGKLTYRGLSTPVPFGNVVAVGDKKGWLHFLNHKNGQYLGRINIGNGAIRMPPLVVNHTLVVLSNGGTLAAFRFAKKH